MLTGIAVGAYAYFPDTVEKHVHIAQMARILTPAASYRGSADDLSVESARTFSPGNGLLAAASPDETDGAIKTVRAPSSPILNSKPTIVRSNGWTTTVVRSAYSSPDANDRSFNGARLSGAARWRLVRDLQTELKRVGCYWGRIDGSWGAGSKYAIGDFLLQVNASLPSDEPDYVMLSLLRAHRGTVCGKACESGFQRSAHGRCLPYAITAEKSRDVQEPDVTVVAPPARLVRSGTAPTFAAGGPQGTFSYPEGRMAIGGPSPNELDPRYSAPDIPSGPPLEAVAPRPLAATEPVIRPDYDARPRPQRKARKSGHNRSAAARKRARRKALIRQAFGDGFD